MAKGNNQKLKLLYLARIFAQETDENNALTPFAGVGGRTLKQTALDITKF